MTTKLEQEIQTYVTNRRERLIGILQDLVRIPSENTAPKGNEKRCQEYVAGFLEGIGFETSMYSLEDVPGLAEHPLYWKGRDYKDRPNVGARRRGRGHGRSLVLSGHIDTVPAGTQPWTRNPFGGEIEGNRLYGRGSNDMKCGIATNLFVAEAVREFGVDLGGDLLVESVVDEEFGGVNGTLAGRLMGYNADAAIISEPSLLRICPAQRGGRTVHLTLNTGPSGGILTGGRLAAGVAEQLRHFLVRVQDFAQQRRERASSHPLYPRHADPVPVAITKVWTGPWGTGEPVSVPETCMVEMYWQAMPGEKQEDIDREFHAWLDSVADSAPDLFPERPRAEFPIRWLPGSAISKGEPLVAEFAACATELLGAEPVIAGIEGPCDMYIFHQQFGIPAILWGAKGSNTHAADEYVEIDSVIDAARVLLSFIYRWCGTN
ncbi:MAG: M20/M25/M40 family metallo-hydrolase [Bryobacteraceae bacterium]|nr:M20/M25/M40 family metallo-hydrolase [Bryobacterales bacterium]MEB2363204.1 M20/M25/M40 family metallo-hydrolase [Bryobacterales bacterium]NUN01856.1 M20/M25/M40 family metallo-hydrolase [Bryobacteraceae bacterium]